MCAAGINLTFRLEELLELRSSSRHTADKLPNSKAGVQFISFLDANERAFEEIYVAAFEVLDRIWLERKASYMDFPYVLQETIAAVRAALLQSPGTIARFREILSLQGEQ